MLPWNEGRKGKGGGFHAAAALQILAGGLIIRRPSAVLSIFSSAPMIAGRKEGRANAISERAKERVPPFPPFPPPFVPLLPLISLPHYEKASNFRVSMRQHEKKAPRGSAVACSNRQRKCILTESYWARASYCMKFLFVVCPTCKHSKRTSQISHSWEDY